MLTIQSDDDSRFSTPKRFSKVADASLDLGIPAKIINSAKSTQELLTPKTTGYAYTITWLPPRSKKEYIDCHSSLTDYDRSQRFAITDLSGNPAVRRTLLHYNLFCLKRYWIVSRHTEGCSEQMKRRHYSQG